MDLYFIHTAVWFALTDDFLGTFLFLLCIFYFMKKLFKFISERNFNFLFFKVLVYYPQRRLSELVLCLGIYAHSLLKRCISKTQLLLLVLLFRGQIFSLTFLFHFSVINGQIWTKNAYDQSILLSYPYISNACHMEVETTLCRYL